jgi:hypothetical protein
MRGRRSAWTITLDSPTRTTLQHWLQRRKTPVGLARCAMLLLDQVYSCVQIATWAGLADYHVRKWAKRFQKGGVANSLHEKSRPGHPPMFVPEVALHLVKLACEGPDHMGSSLSQWDCPELARRLKADGVVSTISADTVQPSACWDLHIRGRWAKITPISSCYSRPTIASSFVCGLASLATLTAGGKRPSCL